MLTRVKTSDEISAMRESGLMLATILDTLKKSTKEGMSTKDLAIIAQKELNKLGGKPTFLGFQGFPDILCTSINDEVVHGIPRSSKIIRSGDIVSLDFGVTYRQMITDAAISFIVGKNGLPQNQKLVDITQQSMYAGIDAVHEAVRTGDIGNAVESVLRKHNYGVIEDLVGHGVGHYLHEDPNIPNYGHRGKGEILHSGMTIAIEPMATLGGHNIVIDDDGWTVLTKDGSWAAHFEHTILITDDGSEILTRLP
jgi:methionyl aminopeptidase